jgi:hypothetical protein
VEGHWLLAAALTRNRRKSEVMIRISITEGALVAIAKTLPEGTVLQVD